jgi:hypothetical protein
MKQRLGFVSNSSSSSFVLAIPKQLTVEEMAALLGVAPDSVLYPLTKEIAKLLITADPRDIGTDEASILALVECETIDELELQTKKPYGEHARVYLEAIRRHWIVIEGFFGDDDDDTTESMLCNTGLIQMDPEKGYLLYHIGGY